jgi:hypothetical protein
MPQQPIGLKHRDINLDAIRGVCLVCMTVNHLQSNWMQRMTFQPLGFISDFETFVFLSGLVAAWMYGIAWQGRGFTAFLWRVFRALRRIYFASMGVTLPLALLAMFGGHRFSDWRRIVYYADVDRAHLMLSLLTFRHTIAFVSYLRFYGLLLCLMPVILYLLRIGQERLLLIASGTMWMCMQLVVATHAIDIETFRGPLLILTWQLMYILGAVTGYRRCISAPSLMPKWRGLVPLCAGVSLVSFVLWHQWPFETLRFEDFLSVQSWLAAKGSLGPLRILDFLALLVVTSFATTKLSVVLEKVALYRWLGWLGQEPLYVFAWSILTSFLCFLLRRQWSALGWPAETAWVLLAVVSLWVAAAAGKVIKEVSKEGLLWASAVFPKVWAEAVGRLATTRRPIYGGDGSL